jgi:hypothetical protein
MDIIQGFIETGNAGKSGWRIVNNKGALGVVNKRTSNVSYSILNNGVIAAGSNFINSYSTTPAPSIPTEIVVAGTTPTIIGTDRCIQFPYSGSASTKDYTFTTTENLICDILVVGGGGAGGGNGGGGGGAGGYVYITNINLVSGTTYNVSVGRGGLGTYDANTSGNNSSITGGTPYIALGGGRGGTRGSQATATSGGSGGGGGGILNGIGLPSIQFSTYGYGVGFAGGNGFDGGYDSAGGGGGGAGSVGTVAGNK